MPTRASRATIASVAVAPINAATPTPVPPNAPSMPQRIASTAASELPDEIPSVNGSASGLRSNACSAQPAPASAPPTSSEPSTRGIRTHRIACIGESGSNAPSPSTSRWRPARSLATPSSGATTATITAHAAHIASAPTNRRAVNRRAAAARDELAHAGTANAWPDGNAPTWISSSNAARVDADASTSAGAPRAARQPSATSHIVPP